MNNQLLDLNKINLNEIGDLVKKYQITPSSNLKTNITNQLSLYIRFFPKLVYKSNNDDLLSEFYMYVYERIETILKKYNPQIGSFRNYLSIRLKTYYLNFVKLYKKNESFKPSPFLLEGSENKITDQNNLFFSDSTLARTSISLDELSNSQYFFYRLFNFSSGEIEKINIDPQNSLGFKYLILKLYFFDFFNEEDFIILKKYLNLSYGALLNKMDNFINSILEKKNIQSKWEIRLNKFYQKINSLTNSNTPSPIKNQTLLKKIEQEQLVALNHYYNLKVHPDIKEIAKLLNEKDKRKIWNLISYQKKIVKNQEKESSTSNQ